MASSGDLEKETKAHDSTDLQPGDLQDLINASGHIQEVDRQFGIWSICSVSLLTDNAWAAGTGALTVAIYNGGPPGILYEYIVVSIFYACIGAGLAELASAIPSSASVYHWASVTAGPKYSRVASFYAGWWNVVAWVYGVASVALFGANSIVGLYQLYHDDYVPERWHIFLAYLGVTWICCAMVLFGQRILARFSNTAGLLCLAFWFTTVMLVAIMPSTSGGGHASNAFVWREWTNGTGWPSGFAFLAGMLNGAFAIGTPDACTHLAEEIPNPKKNIPLGIAAQLLTGFFTTFFLYLALFYGISDLPAILDESTALTFPLQAIYLQATGSKPATAALLVLFIVDMFVCIPGPYITAGRTLWTMARDDGVPFSNWVAHIDPTFRNPFRATFLVGVACTAIGCVFIGSRAAFNAFVGCFAILTTLSYVVPLLAHLLTRRRYIKPGPFYMRGWIGYAVIGTACTYIIVFNVIYLFPYALPLDLNLTMNWSVVMVGGLTVFITLWYLYKRNHGYVGPRVALEANNEVLKGYVGGHEAELAMKKRGEALVVPAPPHGE